IKLEQVALPGAIQCQPVGPSHRWVIRESLPVIHMVARHCGRVANGLVPAKHQQAGQGKPFFSGDTVTAPPAKRYQQADIILGQPGMPSSYGREAIAELSQGFEMQVLERESFENPTVCRFIRLVGKHPPNFLLGAAVIALKAAAIGASKGVTANENRSLPPVCPWHPDSHHPSFTVVDWENFDIPLT